MLLLLLPALFAQLEVMAVFSLVVVDPAHRHLDGSGRDVVYKSPVVGNHHHGFGFGHQEFLQPLDGLDIQVVGRFVEQDQIRLLQQDFSQFDSHSPASGKFRSGALKVFPHKSQSQQDFFYLCLIVDFLDGVELLAEFGDFFDQFVIVL